MKQLGIWGSVYITEYNGVLPHRGGTKPSKAKWDYQYISEKSWWEKASDDGLAGDAQRCPQSTTALSSMRQALGDAQYSMNSQLGGSRDSDPEKASVTDPIPRANRLSGTRIWMGDGSAKNYTFGSPLPAYEITQGMISGIQDANMFSWPWMWKQDWLGWNAQAHPNESNNFVFGDGHTDSVALAEWDDMGPDQRRDFTGSGAP